MGGALSWASVERPAGWVHHPEAAVQRPLDFVVQVAAPAGESPLMLHFIYADDGLYVPAVIRTPAGPGPFPAVLSVHGGSGGLGVPYLVDHVLERGWLFDRLLAEGYVVCCGEGRMEHEDA